jgi:hypothetical protein
MNKMTPEELEQFIHRELRGLPVRPAPTTLEARVLAAIEHRGTIAWYHKSWSYWPAPVRALFLAVATGFAGVAMGSFYLFIQGAEPAQIWQQFGSRFELLSGLYGFAAWTVDFISRMVGTIPTLWLYGGLAFIAGLYATLIGLGATAYRFLYRNNQ